MKPTVAPFRVTEEDLEGLPAATRDALLPLTSSLNVTLRDVVNSINGNPHEEVRTVPLQTPGALAVPVVVFATSVRQPQAVWLANCQPKDTAHILTTPFVAQGFTVTESGAIAIPAITGLLPNNVYTLTFVVRG